MSVDPTAAVCLSADNRARLVQARKSAGVTQDELAERLNTTPQHVGQIETGAGEPTKDLLDRWCSELGLRAAVQMTVEITEAPKSGSEESRGTVIGGDQPETWGGRGTRG